MEADAAFGGFCLKIRGDVADLECHGQLLRSSP
jgi:hypothetical protein